MASQLTEKQQQNIYNLLYAIQRSNPGMEYVNALPRLKNPKTWPDLTANPTDETLERIVFPITQEAYEENQTRWDLVRDLVAFIEYPTDDDNRFSYQVEIKREALIQLQSYIANEENKLHEVAVGLLDSAKSAPFLQAPSVFPLRQINGHNVGLIEREEDAVLLISSSAKNHGHDSLVSALEKMGLVDPDAIYANAVIEQIKDGSGNYAGAVIIPKILGEAIRRAYTGTGVENPRLEVIGVDESLYHSDSPVTAYQEYAARLKKWTRPETHKKSTKDKAEAEPATPKAVRYTLDELMQQDVAKTGMRIERRRTLEEGKYTYWVTIVPDAAPDAEWVSAVRSNDYHYRLFMHDNPAVNQPQRINEEKYATLITAGYPELPVLPYQLPASSLKRIARQKDKVLRLSHFILGPAYTISKPTVLTPRSQKDYQTMTQVPVYLSATNAEVMRSYLSDLSNPKGVEWITKPNEEPAIVCFHISNTLAKDISQDTHGFDASDSFVHEVEQKIAELHEVKKTADLQGFKENNALVPKSPVLVDWYKNPEKAPDHISELLREKLNVQSVGEERRKTPQPKSGKKRNKKSGLAKYKQAQNDIALHLIQLLDGDEIANDVSEPFVITLDQHEKKIGEEENRFTVNWVEPTAHVIVKKQKKAAHITNIDVKLDGRDSRVPIPVKKSKTEHYYIYSFPLSIQTLERLQNVDIFRDRAVGGFTLLKPDGSLHYDTPIDSLLGRITPNTPSLLEPEFDADLPSQFAPANDSRKLLRDRLRQEVVREEQETHVDPVQRALSVFMEKPLLTANVQYAPEMVFMAGQKRAEQVYAEIQGLDTFCEGLDNLIALTKSNEDSDTLPELDAAFATITDALQRNRRFLDATIKEVTQSYTPSQIIGEKAAFVSSLGESRQCKQVYIRHATAKQFEKLQDIANDPHYMRKPPKKVEMTGLTNEMLIECYPTDLFMSMLHEQRALHSNPAELHSIKTLQDGPIPEVDLREILLQRILPEAAKQLQAAKYRKEEVKECMQACERPFQQIALSRKSLPILLREANPNPEYIALEEEEIGTQKAIVFPLSSDRFSREKQVEQLKEIQEHLRETGLLDTAKSYGDKKRLTTMPEQTLLIERLDAFYEAVDIFLAGNNQKFEALWDVRAARPFDLSVDEEKDMVKTMLEARVELKRQYEACVKELPVSVNFKLDDKSYEDIEKDQQFFSKTKGNIRRREAYYGDIRNEFTKAIERLKGAVKAGWNKAEAYRRLREKPYVVSVEDSGKSWRNDQGEAIDLQDLVTDKKTGFVDQVKGKTQPDSAYAVLYVSDEGWDAIQNAPFHRHIHSYAKRNEADPHARKLMQEHLPLRSPEMPHELSQWMDAANALYSDELGRQAA